MKPFKTLKHWMAHVFDVTRCFTNQLEQSFLLSRKEGNAAAQGYRFWSVIWKHLSITLLIIQTLVCVCLYRSLRDRWKILRKRYCDWASRPWRTVARPQLITSRSAGGALGSQLGSGASSLRPEAGGPQASWEGPLCQTDCVSLTAPMLPEKEGESMGSFVNNFLCFRAVTDFKGGIT